MAGTRFGTRGGRKLRSIRRTRSPHDGTRLLGLTTPGGAGVANMPSRMAT